MDRKNNKLFQIGVNEIEALTDASLWNYATFRDYCFNFSYKLEGGKVYGIICECGAGGWALSYTLAGRQKHFNGTITINGDEVDDKILAKSSCYVGEGVIEEKGLFGYKNAIIKQIENGVKTGKSKCHTSADVIKLFNLEDEISRLNRNIYKISNFRWLASIAVGYSYGKMIYCFPWLNTGWIKFVRNQIDRCFEVLKDEGAIILIPTPKLDSVTDIVDDVIYINDSFEGIKINEK